MSTFFIQTRINVPVERGYAAWTRAEELQQWFTKQAEIDLRVNGVYRNADGDCGEFLIVEPNRHLRFTWENPDHCPGTVVDIEFERVSDTTHQVTLIHSELPSRYQAREMKIGWEWAFDSLASWLERGYPISLSEWSGSRTETESKLMAA